MALAYGIGILTTNAFLHAHGITDFSLLKPKAIFTGAIVIGSLGLIGYFPMRLLGGNRDEHPKRYRILTEMFGPLFVLIPICWFLSLPEYVEKADPSPFGSPTQFIVVLTAAVGLYGGALITAGFASQVTKYYSAIAKKKEFAGFDRDWVKFILLASAQLCGLALYISSFANTIYINVPQQFGVRMPERFYFAAKPTGVTALMQVGVKFVPNTNITESMFVIYETTDSFSVLVDYHFDKVLSSEKDVRAATVTIDKSLIDARIQNIFDLRSAIEHLPQK